VPAVAFALCGEGLQQPRVLSVVRADPQSLEQPTGDPAGEPG